MHRGLTVSVPLLRMWVHCPRASNGLLPRRSNLVGYVQWGARSDRFPPCQTIIPTAFRSQSGFATLVNCFALILGYPFALGVRLNRRGGAAMQRRMFAGLFLVSLFIVSGGGAQSPSESEKPVWTMEILK